MTFLSDADLGLLDSLGELLVVLGLVGVVSLFFFPEDRRILERFLGLLFALIALGGVALMWRVDSLGNTDRDLTPIQQVTLSRAISEFRTARFEVFTNRGDREAHALTLKIADAVKAAGGVISDYADDRFLRSGVVLTFADKNADLRRRFSDKVGRQLMAARIVVISDSKPDFADDTVRIAVGKRP